MTKKTETTKPMDPGAREDTRPTVATNNQRECWAVKTLVAEVHALFPETPVEYSGYDGRNTALDVTFDLTGLVNDDAIALVRALGLVEVDERVSAVVAEDSSVLVSMYANPRTQDSRESFDLADAYEVLTEGYGS